MSTTRNISLGITFVAIAMSSCGLLTRPTLHGTLLEPPMPAVEFELDSDHGPVNVASFQGKLVALSFGYASCPDVCPTTMARLRGAVDRLGARADQVQVVMVTVDPERDTAERMGAYARAFDDTFVGLSGDADAVAEAAAGYGIFYARADGSEASGYLVDHTAAITVLNREGRAWLIWPFGVSEEDMASDLKYLISKS